ncbi:MAG: hypothetical protein QM788_10350 [Roseateles sp.]|uniref:hypothetical protein n=1 Tax=Roseateles sp. TaxID=1971397 RepID=UPI0039E97309
MINAYVKKIQFPTAALLALTGCGGAGDSGAHESLAAPREPAAIKELAPGWIAISPTDDPVALGRMEAQSRQILENMTPAASASAASQPP